MRVLVLSDTHAPFRWRTTPAAVADALAEGPELILHAGDVCTPELLGGLAEYAPVLAVRGNNDGRDVAAWGAPDVLETTLDGLRLAMLHDAGVRDGRARRLRRRFPGADLVVFGHSHVPWNDCDAETGLHLFNPGSPTDRRSQPFGTFGWLRIEGGRLISASIRRADA